MADIRHHKTISNTNHHNIQFENLYYYHSLNLEYNMSPDQQQLRHLR